MSEQLCSVLSPFFGLVGCEVRDPIRHICVDHRNVQWNDKVATLLDKGPFSGDEFVDVAELCGGKHATKLIVRRAHAGQAEFNSVVEI